jgi:hypothetical protein
VIIFRDKIRPESKGHAGGKPEPPQVHVKQMFSGIFSLSVGF